MANHPTPTTETPADTAPAIVAGATLAMDDLSTVARNTNPKVAKRKTEYENAVKSLKPGGDAVIFPVGSGKEDSARGIKLRLSYAIKRAGVTGVTVGDATLKASGKPVVYIRIK